MSKPGIIIKIKISSQSIKEFEYSLIEKYEITKPINIVPLSPKNSSFFLFKTKKKYLAKSLIKKIILLLIYKK